MSYIVIAATPDAVSASAGHTADSADNVAVVATDMGAIQDAITAAAANATIIGDETAAGLVADIQTAYDTLNTDTGTLADGLTASSVYLKYDPDVVVTKNALRACVAAILSVVDGAGDLT